MDMEIVDRYLEMQEPDFVLADPPARCPECGGELVVTQIAEEKSEIRCSLCGEVVLEAV
jgi:ribosomal protein S27E